MSHSLQGLVLHGDGIPTVILISAFGPLTCGLGSGSGDEMSGGGSRSGRLRWRLKEGQGPREIIP
jgi:hypothetical protein